MDDWQQIADGLLEANSFMTLATADEDGRPWASPVWYAHAGTRELLWVSDPGARHSRNVAARPEIAVVVFDSTLAPADAQALYCEGRAEQVGELDLAAALDIYSRRSQQRGLRAWDESDVTGESPFRLYRALLAARFVLRDGRERVPVPFA